MIFDFLYLLQKPIFYLQKLRYQIIILFIMQNNLNIFFFIEYRIIILEPRVKQKKNENTYFDSITNDDIT